MVRSGDMATAAPQALGCVCISDPDENETDYPYGPVAVAEFLVASGDAAELLESTYRSLDQIALPVCRGIKGSAAMLIASPGNRVAYAPAVEVGPDTPGAVAFVGYDAMGTNPGRPGPERLTAPCSMRLSNTVDSCC